MARSERLLLLASLLFSGCLMKERPLDPEAGDGLSGSPSPASSSDASADDGHTKRDASPSPSDPARPESRASDAGPANDGATAPQRSGEVPPALRDTGTPDVPGVGDASTSVVVVVSPDAATPRTPDATVGSITPSTSVSCRPDEPDCREFDFESEVDAEGYFGPFWCHPDGNCTALAERALEAPGSSNHVWVSTVAGDNAKGLGTGLNMHTWERGVYQHAEIDFDVWPVSAVNNESAVWFSLQHIDPSNQGHPVISLVSSLEGTSAVLGLVYKPDKTIKFVTPPALGTRAHVHIVLDRIDDTRSSATLSYGGESLQLGTLAMPLRDSGNPAAYDLMLGLFDGQQGRSVGAATATARYDNFVCRATFAP